MNNRFSVRMSGALLLCALAFGIVQPAFAQSRVAGARSRAAARERQREKERERLRRLTPSNPAKPRFNSKGEQIADAIMMSEPIQKTTLEIMDEAAKVADKKSTRQMLMEKGIYPEFEGPDRKNLRQNPDAPAVSSFPAQSKLGRVQNLAPSVAPTLGVNFTAATLSDTGAFPPDTMGAVGPSQFIAFLNGRIRSFSKAGVADGVLNVDPDTFFASVMTPVGGSVVLNFTSDPNVRFDRLSGRWFLTIMDVPCTNATCTTTAPNRQMIAISDAASSNAITPATVWTFYQFTSDATDFADYPSLGIDASALYIGANMFTAAGSFSSTKAFVIPKAPLVLGSAATVWSFGGLIVSSAGPFAPRGVDNPDPANVGAGALGYFIGPDNATFATLMIRRVTNPGSTTVSPTISANIALTVPTTTFPNRVPHLGNTAGTNGQLDSLDDRLYAASMRNGRLWTAHNFRVSAAGVANTAAQARNAVRWYEIQNLSTTPTLVQSGTLFDSAATVAASRHFWIPSVGVNGQGHAALAGTTAGTNFSIDAFFTGRLNGDALGTMAAGTPYTATTFAYNPAADLGGASGRRWGDYSFVSIDPLDDMSFWTIQEFCSGTNTYGVRVARLLAPPPASIANGPVGGLYSVLSGQTSVNVTITGTSVSGSGFFDPGPNIPGAVPFNHITASVSGTNVTVNSVTYNSPTQVTLNLNTVGAALSDPLAPESVRDITITNPDGQSVTRTGILNISVPTAAGASVSGRIATASGEAIARAVVTLTDSRGNVRTAVTNSFGRYIFDGVAAGENYVLGVTSGRYTFGQSTRVISVNDNVADADFFADPR